MKTHLECLVCGKIHAQDLREITDSFSCDACGNIGHALEEKDLDILEKQIRSSTRMGILAGASALLCLTLTFLWTDAIEHDPSKGAFHETLLYILYAFATATLVLAVVNAIGNRRVTF
ncbi:MAG: hypothetical protein AB7F75_12300 [Planctomycetota bacterium]